MGLDMTVVVTGATAGIGLAAVRELAGRGARVIGVGRSARRCEEALAGVLAACPGADVRYLLCDLSSQGQVRALATEIAGLARRVDALVNCAGTVSSHFMTSEDGVELQLAVNHLAPFLLTHELLSLLRAAPQARVITVSSGSHYRTKLNFDDLQMRRHYSCLWQYKRVKLCNVLFSAEFNRRVGKGGTIRAFAADPGLVNTEIGLKGTSGIEKFVWQFRRKGGTDAGVPAKNIAYLALEPSAFGSGALYWKDCAPLRPSPYALREDVAGRLWEASNRLCGIADW